MPEPTLTPDQYFGELRRRREEALHNLETALTRPERVPLAKLPVMGVLIRVVARVYYLAEVQARQHALMHAESDELAALAQSTLDHFRLIQAIRQEIYTNVGTRLDQLQAHMSEQLDQLQAHVENRTDQLQTYMEGRMDSSQVQIDRLRAQMTYLPESINAIVAELRQEVRK